MDNYPIKSVTFGGFDKQDVIRYIEESAGKATAAQQALQTENEALQKQAAALSEELASLRSQLASLSAERDSLQDSLRQEAASRQQLEALRPLEQEVARLRPDAEAYAQFRQRIGAIECEARKRAADLELATVSQLQKTVDLFREQYQALMSTFSTTADHVNSELRKVEVNLTQLPRAMDQAGTELNELAVRLEHSLEQTPS
jgi:chromosome segregation ATPase